MTALVPVVPLPPRADTRADDRPVWQVLRDLSTALDLDRVNISGFGPVVVTLGSPEQVERVAAHFGTYTQRVSQHRWSCSAKIAGLRIQFVADAS